MVEVTLEGKSMIDELEFTDVPPTTKTGVFGIADPAGLASMIARWEWLRIIYNAILAIEVIAVLSLGAVYGRLVSLDSLKGLVVGAVVANVCYCAGPVFNAYLHWLGCRGRAATFSLFAFGTCVAMFLTLLSVLVFFQLSNPEFG